MTTMRMTAGDADEAIAHINIAVNRQKTGWRWHLTIINGYALEAATSDLGLGPAG